MRNEMNYAGRCCLFSTIINYFLAPYGADTGVLAYSCTAQRHKSKKFLSNGRCAPNDPRNKRAGSTISGGAVNANGSPATRKPPLFGGGHDSVSKDEA
jgi:hypothetical protein